MSRSSSGWPAIESSNIGATRFEPQRSSLRTRGWVEGPAHGADRLVLDPVEAARSS